MVDGDDILYPHDHYHHSEICILYITYQVTCVFLGLQTRIWDVPNSVIFVGPSVVAAGNSLPQFENEQIAP